MLDSDGPPTRTARPNAAGPDRTGSGPAPLATWGRATVPIAARRPHGAWPQPTTAHRIFASRGRRARMLSPSGSAGWSKQTASEAAATKRLPHRRNNGGSNRQDGLDSKHTAPDD